jgi:GNAT superfamily N-acetyltransferase
MPDPTDRFFVSTDQAALEMDVIHGFLSTCYWSPGIPRTTLERAIRNSLCFGVFDRQASARPAQIGFGRVISDFATYAYLCDVFVLPTHRGLGASKLLMREILAHPDLQGLRRFALLTRDAHRLYEQFGFKPRTDGGKAVLEIHAPDVYRRGAERPC